MAVFRNRARSFDDPARLIFLELRNKGAQIDLSQISTDENGICSSNDKNSSRCSDPLPVTNFSQEEIENKTCSNGICRPVSEEIQNGVIPEENSNKEAQKTFKVYAELEPNKESRMVRVLRLLKSTFLGVLTPKKDK